jgi:large subunit ribosomal protein L15
MKPHELKPPAGSHKRRKRVGRGEGSGKGKTAGRGTKGTRARGEVSAFFEGGQMPLTRRVPKLKGFKPPHQRTYTPVNLKDLEYVESADIGPDEMRSAGLVGPGRNVFVKVLGVGEVGRKLRVRAHAFSASAKAKIENAGGGAEVIEITSNRSRKGGRN